MGKSLLFALALTGCATAPAQPAGLAHTTEQEKCLGMVYRVCHDDGPTAAMRQCLRALLPLCVER